MLSLLLALLIIYIVLPYFNTLGGKELALDFTNVKIIGGLLGITVITGLFAGSYPALYLSGFMPATVLKGNFTARGSGSVFRNTMVVIQFAVSISLIVGTGIVYRQLKYIQQLNLGYDKENLLYVRMTGDLWEKYDALRSSLESNRLTSTIFIYLRPPNRILRCNHQCGVERKDPNTQPLFYNTAIRRKF
jgi:hypothetical protein